MRLDKLLEDFYEEDVERHAELNPKLFGDDGKLKDEVLEKIDEIVEVFLTRLEDRDINIDITDIILVGSNVSYNYTKDSDLDIHIQADLSMFTGDELQAAMDKLYDAQKSLFNNSMSIDFYGIPVEIFVETNNTELRSNGIYSALNDEWIKAPVLEDIPEIDFSEVEKKLVPYEDRYNAIMKNPNVEDIDKLLVDIRELRKEAMTKDGAEYSTDNLVFKEFRNRGYIDDLKQARDEELSQQLSLENFKNKLNFSDSLTDESLVETNKRINNRDREIYRTEIWRLAHIQPIIQDNGSFQIYNVSEQDYGNIVRKLQRLDYVDYVSASPSGKLNFSKFNFNSGKPLPTRYYTITGQIKL